MKCNRRAISKPHRIFTNFVLQTSNALDRLYERLIRPRFGKFSNESWKNTSARDYHYDHGSILRKKLIVPLTTSNLPSIAFVFFFSQIAIAADPPMQLLLPRGLAESQLWHINHSGDAVGMCELFDAKGNSIVDFVCLFAKGNVRPIPKLDHYRKMECMALSDSGMIVGHAYSPEREEESVLQAVFFDPRNASTVLLPNLPTTKATLATAISGDGKTIVGVCSGQACVWDRNNESWTVSPLPQKFNGLSTQKVCLSDDGKIAIAFQRGKQITQLAQWSRDEAGDWQYAIRLESDITPHDVNNAATIVGSKVINSVRLPETRGFVLSPGEEIELIEPLDGDNFSTARSVNNYGVVVGWSDGVGNNSKWPRSFVWVRGQLQPLEMLPAMTPSQAYGINDNGEVVGLLEREDDLHSVGFVAKINSLR